MQTQTVAIMRWNASLADISTMTEVIPVPLVRHLLTGDTNGEVAEGPDQMMQLAMGSLTADLGNPQTF